MESGKDGMVVGPVFLLNARGVDLPLGGEATEDVVEAAEHMGGARIFVAEAALIVNAARPITERVNVNLIAVADDDGTDSTAGRSCSWLVSRPTVSGFTGSVR